MIKWTAIFFGMLIGLVSTSIGVPMVVFGILSFFITWTRNPHLNTIGIISFFVGIPVIALGVHIVRKNWKYIAGKESWYR
jgi:formate hydrogenlyase subunit 3/multisubunit Na+/H+ antiporter MnhD subunit